MIRSLILSILFLIFLAGCSLFGDDKDARGPVADGLTPKTLYELAEDKFSSGSIEQGIEQLEVILSAYPGSKYAIQARLDIAYNLFKRKKYNRAILELNEFIERYPALPSTPYAYYLRGIIAEENSPDRFRQSNDEYPHEVLGKAPYDGMLISLSTLGISKGSSYSQGQRFRMMREGIREFLRFPCKNFQGDPDEYPIMGDCGSFSKDKENAKLDLKEILEYYEACGFTHGISPDQIIVEKNESWVNLKKTPSKIITQAEYTSQKAEEFFVQSKINKVSFEPVGVVQGWSLKSFSRYANKLVEIGYKYIALGGLASRPTKEIYRIALEVITKIPPHVKVHILGFNRFDYLEKFHGLGIYSFDSTSPLLRAFKDARFSGMSPAEDGFSSF